MAIKPGPLTIKEREEVALEYLKKRGLETKWAEESIKTKHKQSMGCYVSSKDHITRTIYGDVGIITDPLLVGIVILEVSKRGESIQIRMPTGVWSRITKYMEEM